MARTPSKIRYEYGGYSAKSSGPKKPPKGASATAGKGTSSKGSGSDKK